jgi:N-acetylglucosaminyldiphosphoundecaprenol N-acetyl-beta-D-mannosaminyltransferase
MSAESGSQAQVLGVRIDAVELEQCVDRVARWAAARESRYVCLCNAHSVVTARRDPRFARVLAGADLALPDGAPIAWRMRRRGHPRQQRLSGPDVMWLCCISAAAAGLPVFLLGGTPETLARLAARLRRELPGLRLAGTLAPPFRPMASAEEAAIATPPARGWCSSGSGAPSRSAGWRLSTAASAP